MPTAEEIARAFESGFRRPLKCTALPYDYGRKFIFAVDDKWGRRLYTQREANALPISALQAPIDIDTAIRNVGDLIAPKEVGAPNGAICLVQRYEDGTFAPIDWRQEERGGKTPPEISLVVRKRSFATAEEAMKAAYSEWRSPESWQSRDATSIDFPHDKARP